MTNITFKTHSDPIDYSGDIHILTIAELGLAFCISRVEG